MNRGGCGSNRGAQGAQDGDFQERAARTGVFHARNQRYQAVRNHMDPQIDALAREMFDSGGVMSEGRLV